VDKCLNHFEAGFLIIMRKRNKLGQFVKGKYLLKKCLICGKEFEVYLSRINAKFCSFRCYNIWQKTHLNKGTFKKGMIPSNWKGDKASTTAMHIWVYRHKGKPEICEHCGATCVERRLNWANKDHKYRRNLDDYIALCYSCHRKYDYKYNPQIKSSSE
jgi:endogenous inhibitor of DNA gyrase (YacG/DUF329 family)